MTPANNYLEKAAESLAGAESEYVNGRFNNSANRCYYACFQAAIAALLRVGLRPAGHAGGLAAMTVVSPNLAAWAAVVTTAAGAVAAHGAGERYEFLWVEYTRTASELRRLADRRTAADGRRLSYSDLIIECEGVISVQNQAWMANSGEEKQEGLTGGRPGRQGGQWSGW